MLANLPQANSWGYYTTNQDLASSTAQGTSVTGAQNGKGGGNAQLIASLGEDCYLIQITTSEITTSAAAKDALLDILIDPAGGSSYSVLIPDLLVSCAGSINNAGGVTYLFPLFVPAGASLAARLSVNNATPGTARVLVRLWGKPSRPDLIQYGTYVTAFGVTGASSSGTAVTPGTNAEGASWVSLGSPTKPHWWWQCGLGVNDSTMAALVYHLDLAAGDGSNKDLIITNSMVGTSAAEAVGKAADVGNTRLVTTTETLYVRANCSGTPDANISMAAYGLG